MPLPSWIASQYDIRYPKVYQTTHLALSIATVSACIASCTGTAYKFLHHLFLYNRIRPQYREVPPLSLPIQFLALAPPTSSYKFLSFSATGSVIRPQYLREVRRSTVSRTLSPSVSCHSWRRPLPGRFPRVDCQYICIHSLLGTLPSRCWTNQTYALSGLRENTACRSWTILWTETWNYIIQIYSGITSGKLTLTLLFATIDVQWEGIGDVGSARYEPALLPPCSTIRVLSYSN